MRVTTGSFDSNGSPTLKIQVAGVFSSAPTEFQVIIDTGFSGFLSMPLIQAFPLGLPLSGTTSVSLADGATHSKLMASARVTVAGQTKIGLAILEPSSTDILLGMDFLRTFKLAMIVSEMGVALFDEAELQQTLKDAAATAAKSEGSQSENETGADEPGSVPPTTKG